MGGWNPSGSGYYPLVGFYECNIELSGFVEDWEFLD
jgi:hypothetical protein